MPLIQPQPDWTSPIVVAADDVQACPVPVSFVRFRYLHHAAPSGYDRICDYVDAPTVPLPRSLYWLGETVLRPWAIWQAKRGGKFEYSRYDCILECAVVREFLKARERVFHFVYAEKSFHLLEKHAGRNDNMLVGTVHHPPEHSSWLFENTDHFRVFDRLIVMDPDSIAFWQGVTGKDNVCWLPHGIDTDYFCPAERDPDATSRRVVFAGTHERDFETLQHTVRRMAAERPHIGFDLIGGHEVLSRLAGEFESVQLHTNVSDAEYLRIIQGADLVYLPLLRSTVCNAVLEGMACGLGIVTSEGGITAYLSDEMSAATPVGDAEASRQALCRMLDRPAAQLRAAALSHVQDFSWPAVARRHIELYESVRDARLSETVML